MVLSFDTNASVYSFRRMTWFYRVGIPVRDWYLLQCFISFGLRCYISIYGSSLENDRYISVTIITVGFDESKDLTVGVDTAM